jgi:hypothetical protein
MQRDIELVRGHFQHAIDLLTSSPTSSERVGRAEVAIGAGERRLQRLSEVEAELDELQQLGKRARDLLKHARETLD